MTTTTATSNISSAVHNVSEPTTLRVRTTQQSISEVIRSNLTSPRATLSTTKAAHTAQSITTERTREKLTEIRTFTSQMPASSKVERKSTRNMHVVHTSEDEGLLSRRVMGLQLKYIFIASGSFVVMAIAIFLLVCQLCKQRCVNQLILCQLNRYPGCKELLFSCFWLRFLEPKASHIFKSGFD